MSCDLEIHDELIDSGEVYCPFCDQQISSVNTKNDVSCCASKEIIIDDGFYVCINCGSVFGYELVNEYIDYYENQYRIRRKSIYQRKYHLENRLIKFNLRINERNEILSCFKQVENAINKLEQPNRRFPILDYLFYKILRLKYEERNNLNYKANMTKCKRPIGEKTLQQYEILWKKLCEINSWNYIITDKIYFIKKKKGSCEKSSK